MSELTQLGYLGFEVSDLSAWKRFATDTLGLTAHATEFGLALRMDSHAQRFLLREGPKDDLCLVGWEVRGPDALDRLVTRLRASGCDVTEASEDERRDRSVEALVRTQDPAGNPIELYYGPKKAYEPFVSPHVKSGFVAEGFGLGHVVLATENKAESIAFYEAQLGFRMSDHIVCEIYGHPVDVSFLHINGRHHSLALGSPLPKKIHHFMLEVGAIDDVGRCYDRAIRGRHPIMQTLGRHPNDRMISFYAQTPSGFQFELGCGGRVVDDASWAVTTYDHISEWGHHHPAALAPRKKK